MAQGPWFYCLKHHTVEDRDGCAERHRLGPYATREEAEHALQSVAEREEQLTEEDRRWQGDRCRTTLLRTPRRLGANPGRVAVPVRDQGMIGGVDAGRSGAQEEDA